MWPHPLLASSSISACVSWQMLPSALQAALAATRPSSLAMPAPRNTSTARNSAAAQRPIRAQARRGQPRVALPIRAPSLAASAESLTWNTLLPPSAALAIPAARDTSAVLRNARNRRTAGGGKTTYVRLPSGRALPAAIPPPSSRLRPPPRLSRIAPSGRPVRVHLSRRILPSACSSSAPAHRFRPRRAPPPPPLKRLAHSRTASNAIAPRTHRAPPSHGARNAPRRRRASPRTAPSRLRESRAQWAESDCEQSQVLVAAAVTARAPYRPPLPPQLLSRCTSRVRSGAAKRRLSATAVLGAETSGGAGGACEGGPSARRRCECRSGRGLAKARRGQIANRAIPIPFVASMSLSLLLELGKCPRISARASTPSRATTTRPRATVGFTTPARAVRRLSGGGSRSIVVYIRHGMRRRSHHLTLERRASQRDAAQHSRSAAAAHVPNAAVAAQLWHPTRCPTCADAALDGARPRRAPCPDSSRHTHHVLGKGRVARAELRLLIDRVLFLSWQRTQDTYPTTCGAAMGIDERRAPRRRAYARARRPHHNHPARGVADALALMEGLPTAACSSFRWRAGTLQRTFGLFAEGSGLSNSSDLLRQTVWDPVFNFKVSRSLQIKGNASAIFAPLKTLKLSNATLGSDVVGEDGRTVVLLTHDSVASEDGCELAQSIPIFSLTPIKNEHTCLDIILTKGQRYSFKAQGPK
ncbi:hypothetical protein B0H15DRAFT_968865 [Mycena belliarum]|uniref:Nucleoplasmin-like domain-containing protein n=1 Tax=Mycena belliarum TaxID=1033014 RepID=A0AAD6XI18_9AGAR|nr:hypothetical protein B0H15DRAFT_968865 [Mycena belliae]